MKWIAAAAMGVVLTGCGQQAASTDKTTEVKAAPEVAKVDTPVKPAKAADKLPAVLVVSTSIDEASLT